MLASDTFRCSPRAARSTRTLLRHPKRAVVGILAGRLLCAIAYAVDHTVGVDQFVRCDQEFLANVQHAAALQISVDVEQIIEAVDGTPLAIVAPDGPYFRTRPIAVGSVCAGHVFGGRIDLRKGYLCVRPLSRRLARPF